MKTYVVRILRDSYADVEVEAENKEEAQEKAAEINVDDLEFEDGDYEQIVIDELDEDEK